MHNCVRCGRPAGSIEEIDDGCPCGSKVFHFSQDKGEETVEKPPEENGKMPSAYFARTTFSAEDVENIKIVTEGVFVVDVNALSKNPVVLRDEEGVYYVRIPFEKTKWDGKKGESGAKEKKDGKKGFFGF